VFLNHGEKTACLFFFAVSIHDRLFDQFLQPRLAERREICPRLAFQAPQMQNRQAIVPFRYVSPLIKGSLGDRFSTC
jgi:hypothetical protein